MSNAHLGIINDVGKIISREAVFFDEDDVVLRLGTGMHFAHDFVAPGVCSRV